MLEEVKKCVDTKINFFDEYFTIPQNMQIEFNRFCEKITTLGEQCGSATEFEEKFVSTGLSDQFNAILPKCTPKSRKMTSEEKQQSKKLVKEMISENKKEILTDALTDAAERVGTATKDELLKKSREKMIEDGSYADYTITKNRFEDAGRLVNFFKNKFKKQ